MAPAECSLVSSFIARQLIILVAGLIFLAYTYVRVRLNYERRDLATFVADVSKQAGQQAFGGVLMVVLGVLLAEGGLDALAWYGAEYPFEIVLTTIFTSWLRTWSEQFFAWLQQRTGWECLTPFNRFGQYGPEPGTFLCSWYAAQMVQAVIIIGVFSRIFSVLLIVASLSLLPEECVVTHCRRPPCALVATAHPLCVPARLPCPAQVQPGARRREGLVLLWPQLRGAHCAHPVCDAGPRRRGPVHHHRPDTKVQAGARPGGGPSSRAAAATRCRRVRSVRVLFAAGRPQSRASRASRACSSPDPLCTHAATRLRHRACRPFRGPSRLPGAAACIRRARRTGRASSEGQPHGNGGGTRSMERLQLYGRTADGNEYDWHRKSARMGY